MEPKNAPEATLASIDISNQRLFELPDGVWRGKHCMPVERFLAAYNYFSYLPPQLLWNMPLLRVLDLRHNCFVYLPDGLHHLASLQQLRLSSNKLKALHTACDQPGPTAAQSGTGKQQQTGTSSSVPQLSQLRLLTTLSIGHNFVKPEQLSRINNMRSLEDVDATNNRLKDLPRAFLANCRRLRRIAIGGNPIGRIPRTLLVNILRGVVAELSFPGMRLTWLPEELGELSTLREFDVSGNLLTCLPSTMVKLSNLESLYLDNNSFAHAPEILYHLRSLQQLTMSHNHLEHISHRFANLSCLEVLDVDHCHLRWIPSQVFGMKSLRLIKARGNQLCGLPEQPAPQSVEILADQHTSPTEDPACRSIMDPDLLAEYNCSSSGSCNYWHGSEKVLLVGARGVCSRVFSSLSLHGKAAASSETVEATMGVNGGLRQCKISVPACSCNPNSKAVKTIHLTLLPLESCGHGSTNLFLSCHPNVLLCMDVTELSASADTSVSDIIEMISCAGSQVNLMLVGLHSANEALSSVQCKSWHDTIHKVTDQVEAAWKDQVQTWHAMSDRFHQYSSNKLEDLEADLIAQELSMLWQWPSIAAATSSQESTEILETVSKLMASDEHGSPCLPIAWMLLTDAINSESLMVKALPLAAVIELAEGFGMSASTATDALEYLHYHERSVFSSHVLPTGLDQCSADVVFTDIAWMLARLEVLATQLNEDNSPTAASESNTGVYAQWRRSADVHSSLSEFTLDVEVRNALLAIAVHFGYVSGDVFAVAAVASAAAAAHTDSLYDEQQSIDQFCRRVVKSAYSGTSIHDSWKDAVADDQDELGCLFAMDEVNLLFGDFLARCSHAADITVALPNSAGSVCMRMASFWQVKLTQCSPTSPHSNGAMCVRLQLRAPHGLCQATWLLFGWLVTTGVRLSREYPTSKLVWPCPHCAREVPDGAEAGFKEVATIDVLQVTTSGLELLSCPSTGALFHRHLLAAPDADADGMSEEQHLMADNLRAVLASAHRLAVSAMSQHQQCPCVGLVRSVNSRHDGSSCPSAAKEVGAGSVQCHNGLVVNAGDSSTIIVLENATIVTDCSACTEQGLLTVDGRTDESQQEHAITRGMPAIQDGWRDQQTARRGDGDLMTEEHAIRAALRTLSDCSRAQLERAVQSMQRILSDGYTADDVRLVQDLVRGQARDDGEASGCTPMQADDQELSSANRHMVVPQATDEELGAAAAEQLTGSGGSNEQAAADGVCPSNCTQAPAPVHNDPSIRGLPLSGTSPPPDRLVHRAVYSDIAGDLPVHTVASNNFSPGLLAAVVRTVCHEVLAQLE
ncbi:uncharacterized protein LOC135809478 isoform X2 [Sycon ciliatum]|uniref:uncharacterized protein LOC135809478 isoform X2 n=1 Tax=Sycon ciliatum TaxID=27933 RepID=UPI0031F60EF0